MLNFRKAFTTSVPKDEIQRYLKDQFGIESLITEGKRGHPSKTVLQIRLSATEEANLMFNKKKALFTADVQQAVQRDLGVLVYVDGSGELITEDLVSEAAADVSEEGPFPIARVLP